MSDSPLNLPDTTRGSSALILGAGLAGLSAALSLVRRGWSVTVLEKEVEVGGLARTVRLGPRIAFDLGGHRFFTSDQGLLREVEALLEGEWVEVPRRSRIYLGGRFFNYPLRPAQALFSFGPLMSLRIIADYLWGHLRSLARGAKEETFEDWALARFGGTLYRIFFKPYTEKVWGIPARELSAHWSRERIDLLHLSHALARAIFPSRDAQPRTYASAFLYPRDGIGRIAEALATEIRRLGGEIVCGMEIREMTRADGRVASVIATDPTGRPMQWTPHQVVSTIPLPRWVSLLRPDADPTLRHASSQLAYRHMVLVFLLLSGDRVGEDTWIYIPTPDLRVCRIHEPKNWSPALVPDGMTSICAELFSSRDGDLWGQQDEAIVALVVRELQELGLVDPTRVVETHVVRIPYTHPVYEVGFKAHLEAVQRFISSEMTNFHLLGRTGAFQYRNMDQVMADGFGLGERLDRLQGGA